MLPFFKYDCRPEELAIWDMYRAQRLKEVGFFRYLWCRFIDKEILP